MKLIKLYETKSCDGCGKVVGEVWLEGLDYICPLDLFDSGALKALVMLNKACLSQNQFLDYANGRKCKALYLTQPHRYLAPQDLPAGMHAPQNFCYGDDCIYLAIHKIWADKILSGEKQIEIRKSFIDYVFFVW